MANVIRDEASKAFFEKRYGTWTEEDEVRLEARLAMDPAFAQAHAEVSRSWSALGTYAESPEIVTFREQALADLRRSNTRRWRPQGRRYPLKAVAGIMGIAFALGVLWHFLPYGLHPGQYQTRVGELRMLELDDHSRIAIDAASKLAVHYSDNVRVVHLLEGQAEFSVARDPARPFEVQVGDRTIIALGTDFSVDYTDREIRVTMLDGKVLVTAAPPDSGSAHNARARGGVAPTENDIELAAGESLSVDHNGRTTVVADADVQAATAWRQGKVILRATTLEEAVQRMNHYSRVKLTIGDASLASEHISGVFEAGNTLGFIDDVGKVFPIEARHVNAQTIELTRR